MQGIDLSKPGEKKKLIWAGALGLVAIVVLWWTFIGFDSGPKTAQRRAVQLGLEGWMRTMSSHSAPASEGPMSKRKRSKFLSGRRIDPRPITGDITLAVKATKSAA